jgi:glycosyltransferase involved in cell wall biosynthesis
MTHHTADPLISVITPCCQHGRFLPAAIESVLSQSRPDVEMLIVDDGSTDNTGEVIETYRKRYPGRVIGLRSERVGQSRARDLAGQEARGRYWVLLDADDMLEPRMVERCLAVFAKEDKVDAVVGNAWVVNEPATRVLTALRHGRIPGWPAVLWANPIGANASVMLRADSVRGVGGLAVQGLSGVEDWDLWTRMIRCGLRFVNIPYYVMRYRQNSGSYSRRALDMLTAKFSLFEICARDDPRLRGRPNVGPPIDAAFHARLRNNGVFHALGIVVARGEPLAQWQEIADHLAPTGLVAEECTRAFVNGLWHGSVMLSYDVRPRVRSGADAIRDVLRRRLPEAAAGEVSRALTAAGMKLRDPEWKKMLKSAWGLVVGQRLAVSAALARRRLRSRPADMR